METFWVSIAAAIIAIATLILGGFSLKQKANFGYVESLERRLSRAEESLERCRESEKELKETIERLENTNVNLMRRLTQQDDED